MLGKYLNTNTKEYIIERESKDNFGFEYDNTDTNNIITLQLIKESIKALQTLLNIKDYKITINGTIGTYNNRDEIEVLKINKDTIEIMDYTEKSTDKKVKIKIKANNIEGIDTYKRNEETFELLKDENNKLIQYTEYFYYNFINRVTIKYTI